MVKWCVVVLPSRWNTIKRALQQSELIHASLHSAVRVVGIDDYYDGAPMT